MGMSCFTQTTRAWNDDDVDAADPANTRADAPTALDAQFEMFQKQKEQDLERERVIKEHEAQRLREEEEEKARLQAELEECVGLGWRERVGLNGMASILTPFRLPGFC